jgi:hypothetical protein
VALAGKAGSAHPRTAYFGHSRPVQAPRQDPLGVAQAQRLLERAGTPESMPTSPKASGLNRLP